MMNKPKYILKFPKLKSQSHNKLFGEKKVKLKLIKLLKSIR